MKQPITGFHQDDQRHWVAELSCGHVQHVRHDPPLVTREWTQSSQGRQSMLGYKLDCLKCDDGDPVDEIKMRTMLQPKRTNTILYCEKWAETVAFYRDALGFKVTTDRNWFVEFQLTDDSFLSVANAEKTSIKPVDGQGITLTWEVADVNSLSEKLHEIGVETTEVKQNWGALSCMFHDPEGHRIEIWQTVSSPLDHDLDLDSSVPDWVIEHPDLHAFFERIGIDYCCEGKSLSSACREKNLDPETVMQQMRQYLLQS